MKAVPAEFSRLVTLDRLGGRWTEIDVVATQDERAAVAARLMLPSIAALSCRFRLKRDSADPAVVQAEGILAAEVEQVCVVTLEPFRAAVGEAFRLRFIPDAREPADDDPESDDELPYRDAVLDLGEAAVEQLALALDPFPRSPDATVPVLDEEPPTGPFAALAARRRN